MAPPDGAAVSDDAMGLTQRELLMEMREDIKGLKATVDAIAKDQALGVERRASMQRSADSNFTRLDQHERDLDRMQAWRHRADGAMALARWPPRVAGLAGGRRAPGPRRHRPRRERRHPVTDDLSAYGLGALPDPPDERA